MRLGYRKCFHTLYNENKKNKKYPFWFPNYPLEVPKALNNQAFKYHEALIIGKFI